MDKQLTGQCGQIIFARQKNSHGVFIAVILGVEIMQSGLQHGVACLRACEPYIDTLARLINLDFYTAHLPMISLPILQLIKKTTRLLN